MKQWLFGALTATEELPLWKELWVYFYETYFTDETVYENLNMGGGSLISVRNIIVGLFVGLAVASFAVVFNKRVLGGFVRRLLKEECLSPERGKSLPELDLADRLILRRAVRCSTNLRRVVKCREEEAFRQALGAETVEGASKPSRKKDADSAFRVDPDEHHFYIPEDMKYMADIKFDQKGTTWLGAVLFVGIMAVALVVVLMLLPQLLSLLNELAGSFGGSGSVGADSPL